MAYESEGSLKLYLREISKTPLLTAEEEVALAERIKNGDQEARSHMIRANLRLVVKIAQDYANYGMPVTDLISEGNIGLMKAVERFDPEKGGKLSTYAAWWIKQSIKRALANQSKTIRLPVHMVDKIAKMRRIAAMLTEVSAASPPTRNWPTKSACPAASWRCCAKRPTARPRWTRRSTKAKPPNTAKSSATSAPSTRSTCSPTRISTANSTACSVLDERERRIIDERFGLRQLRT
jgi:RNA polymerase primary sigma factor